MTYSVSSNKKYFFKIDNNLNFLFSKFTTYDLHVRSLFNTNDTINQFGHDTRVLTDERNSNFYRSFVNDTFVKKNVYNYSFYQIYKTLTAVDTYPSSYFNQQRDEYSLIKIFNPKNKNMSIRVKNDPSSGTNSIILSKNYPANSGLVSLNVLRQGNFIFQNTNNPETKILNVFNQAPINIAVNISENNMYKFIKLSNLFASYFKESTLTPKFSLTGSYLLLDTKSNNNISGLTCIQNNSFQNSLFCQNYYINNCIPVGFKVNLKPQSGNTNFENPSSSDPPIPKIVFYDDKSSVSLNIDSKINNIISKGKGGGLNTRLGTTTFSPEISPPGSTAGTAFKDTNAIFNLKSISDINIHNNQGGRIYDDHPAHYSVSNTRTFWEY